jgi:hypothetical protein
VATNSTPECSAPTGIFGTRDELVQGIGTLISIVDISTMDILAEGKYLSSGSLCTSI